MRTPAPVDRGSPGRSAPPAATRRLTALTTALLIAAPLALAALSAPAVAQAADDGLFGPWEWQNPLPQGNGLNGVAFAPDGTTAVAAGGHGTTLRSADAGASWEQTPNPVTDANEGHAFFEAEFADENTAIAVGTVGYDAFDEVEGGIFRSTDGGATWSVQEHTTKGGGGLWDVSFPDANNGWAVGVQGTGNGCCDGAAIFRSTDGGATWEDQSTNPGIECAFGVPSICGVVGGVHFVDENTGYIAGGNFSGADNIGQVRRTDDGGATWQEVNVPDQQAWNPFFLDADTGFVTGIGGHIWRTTDGGQTWELRPSGTVEFLTDVFFVDDNTGWITGQDGVILHTTDAGLTWTLQDSGTELGLTGVQFADANTGIAVGANGFWLTTSDGGATWETDWSTVTRESLRAVSFVDASTGWVGGSNGELLATTDAGATWTQQDPGITDGILDMQFVDEDTGFAVSRGSEFGQPQTWFVRVLRTTDGGATWEEVFFEERETFIGLNAVSVPDAGTIVAAGWNLVLRSEDGGDTWTEQDTKSERTSFNSVFFTDADHGVLVGDRRIAGDEDPGVHLVLTTNDGGATWTDVAPATDGVEILVDVAFGDADHGVTTARGGEILRTSDGGATWQTFDPGTWWAFESVSCADANVCTAVAMSTAGGGRPVYRTEDGGATWQAEQRRAQHLSAVDMIDADTAVAVGGNLIIRRGAGDGEPPPPGDASQEIVATVPEGEPGDGSLIISVDPDDRTVTLPPMTLAGTGDRLATDGELRPVTVTDTRTTTNPGWDASAQVSEFTGDAGSFGGGYLGWTPEVASTSEGQTVTAGAQVAAGFPTGDGLAVPQTLATAAADAGVGTAVLGAGLALQIPVDTPAGTYTAILTLTAI